MTSSTPTTTPLAPLSDAAFTATNGSTLGRSITSIDTAHPLK